jgi:hypothetical protein
MNLFLMHMVAPSTSRGGEGRPAMLSAIRPVVTSGG